MMTTWTFLSLLFAIHAFPNVHASISSHSLCYRLVPHHITAVTTPCRYPCLLRSSYIQPRVHVNYEIDGTPCLIPGSHSAGRHEVSHCIDGVCVQRKSSLALKRSKRSCLLFGAAYNFIKKIKEAKRRKKERKIAGLAASYGGSSSAGEAEGEGRVNVGAGGEYGERTGSWAGSTGGGSAGLGGGMQGGFRGGDVGSGGIFPGSLEGASADAGGVFPRRFEGAQRRPSGALFYWSQNNGEGDPGSIAPTGFWRTNSGDGGTWNREEPSMNSRNFGPSSGERFGSAYTSSDADSYGRFGGDSGDYRKTN